MTAGLDGWGRNANIDAVSGGFAVVQPGSVLSINAVEGYPLEDFSAEVRKAAVHVLPVAANRRKGRAKPDR